MRNKRKLKKQNKLIMISIICMTLLLSVGYAAFSTNIVLKGKGNIKEKSRVIQSWAADANTDFHNQEYRENILSITFLDIAKVPNNAVQSWDVSEVKDKGVMAYVTINEEDNTKYDLYIGAKEGVIANENSSYLFRNFINTKTINFNNNFDTSEAVSMASMFNRCESLTYIDVSSFDTSNVQNMNSMFAAIISGQTPYKSSLTEIKGLDKWNTSKVEKMDYMFEYNFNLTKFDLSNWNTNKVRTMSGIFNNCRSLTTLDLSNFQTDNLEVMSYMFWSCTRLVTLNLKGFNTSKVKTTYSLFDNCTSLTTIYVSDEFVTSSINNSSYTFRNCRNLIGGNGTTYDADHTDKEYARIDTASTPGYFTLKTE